MKKYGYIPEQWKIGLVIPVYKGHPKNKSDPNSYRPITLLPVIYKVLERVILNRILDWIKTCLIPFPNEQQHGFRQNVGCSTASFTLHETIYANLEQNSNVYIAFLDILKAFDTVWHTGLMNKLYDFGINGSLHRLIFKSYQNICGTVVCNGYKSSVFPIHRGVRQGGVLSTFLYQLYLNDLLETLQRLNLGATVHMVYSGSPTLADDIALIATTPLNLQAMLDCCHEYSSRWKFNFSSSKSAVMIFGKKKQKDFRWTIGNEVVNISESYCHLGIPISDSLKHTEKIDRACQKGRNSLHGILGFEKKQPDINPMTNIKLYRKVVMPSVLYGCETWTNMRLTDISKINQFQHYAVKLIQNLRHSTRSDMCESLVGLRKLSTEVDKRKLLFFQKLVF